MRGPRFTVASGVVVLLAAFAVFTKTFAPAIPQGAPNKLAESPSDYLRQAKSQQITWYPPGAAAFAEARRSQKPVFVLIGAAWCADARKFDRVVLEDPEVQADLRQAFVCVRVDASMQPDWMQCFLPISRATANFVAGLQGWVLDPQGRVVGYVDLSASLISDEPGVFLEIISSVRDRYDDMLAGRAGLPAPGIAQRSDVMAIQQAPPAEPPPPDEYLSALLRSGDYENGGFPRGERQTLRAGPFRLLALAGRTAEFRALLDPLLRGPIVDWLDGGFFRGSNARDWSEVEYDKLAVANAEMLAAIAMASLSGDGFLKSLATEFTTDFVAEFSQGQLFTVARIGDEDSRGNSPRSGFLSSQVREIFPSPELDAPMRQYARTVLGLGARDNPRLTLRVNDPERLLGEGLAAFHEARVKLWEIKKSAPKRFAEPLTVDASATCSARILETGRLLDDRTLIATGQQTIEALDAFRKGSVVHHLAIESPSLYVGDFLAYADANLQAYLCTGSPEYFQRGLRTLQRARSLFNSKDPGVWTIRPSAQQGGPPDTMVPEIVDNIQESAEAKAIRLLFCYGTLVGSPAGELLLEAAVKKRRAYGSLTAQLGLLGASYYCASALSLQPVALVQGKGAVELASRLQRKCPGSFVAPDLLGRLARMGLKKPGIFVGYGEAINGPFSFEEAVARLPHL